MAAIISTRATAGIKQTVNVGQYVSDMQVSPNFYEVVANLIPVLLVALAVERFASSRDEGDDRPSQLTTAIGAIAGLTVAECFALAAVATGSDSDLVAVIVTGALAIGWMLLVMAYVNKILADFESGERGSRKRRCCNLIVLAVGLFCPVVFLLAYSTTLAIG